MHHTATLTDVRGMSWLVPTHEKTVYAAACGDLVI